MQRRLAPICFVLGRRITVVADDQSGLAEAPGDLPLEPQDLSWPCLYGAPLSRGQYQLALPCLLSSSFCSEENWFWFSLPYLAVWRLRKSHVTCS